MPTNVVTLQKAPVTSTNTVSSDRGLYLIVIRVEVD